MYQETKKEFNERIRQAECQKCVFFESESGNGLSGVCYYNPESGKAWEVWNHDWCAHFVKGEFKNPEE